LITPARQRERSGGAKERSSRKAMLRQARGTPAHSDWRAAGSAVGRKCLTRCACRLLLCGALGDGAADHPTQNQLDFASAPLIWLWL
ncbi:hypothetical protein, partial [Klebsiella pneumoniae]